MFLHKFETHETKDVSLGFQNKPFRCFYLAPVYILFIDVNTNFLAEKKPNILDDFGRCQQNYSQEHKRSRSYDHSSTLSKTVNAWHAPSKRPSIRLLSVFFVSSQSIWSS